MTHRAPLAKVGIFCHDIKPSLRKKEKWKTENKENAEEILGEDKSEADIKDEPVMKQRKIANSFEPIM